MDLSALPEQRALLVLSDRLGDRAPLLVRLRHEGWQVRRFSDVPGLARFLRHNRDFCGAGLVDLRGLTDPQQLAERVPVLSPPHLGWVAAIDAGELEDPGVRQLVRDYCFDFVTLPCPDAVLDTVIGHAYGLALLGRAPSDVEDEEAGFGGMIGRSPQMRSLFRLLRKAAPSDAPVFIAGETGTGKELAAQALHQHSARAAMPFVAINCGAIPPHLLQSELFGYERGAFTGAHQRKLGRIELAHRGTLFLDEIGDLPLDSQTALLRFLEQGTIERLGGTDSLHIDVRLVSATHHDLEAAVAAGRFRSDLYHRLCVIRVRQPALRERGEDIERIAQHALSLYVDERSRHIKGFGPCALRRMQDYPWPGNVRELLNRVRQAVVMTEGRYIDDADMGLDARAAQVAPTLEEVRAEAEREAILSALRRNRQRIGETARELGVSRVTLYRLMTRHQLRAPEPAEPPASPA